MSRRTMSTWALPMLLPLLALLVMTIALAIVGCSRPGPTVEAAHSESAEFSTLDSGQGRFGMSDTNLGSCFVIVDRSTGVQYLLYGEGQGYGSTSWSYTGLCPLLDADGRPLLVGEAER